MRFAPFVISLLALWVGGCIGTDLVDEPIGTDRSAVNLSRESLSLLPGETFPLQATYLDFDGDTAMAVLAWRSQAASIASVGPDGLVKAEQVGQTRVLVETPDGLTDSCLVTVVPDTLAVATVEIMGVDEPLAVGETRLYTAVALTQGGQVIADQMVIWSSSMPGVATVDEQGEVRGVSEGNTQLVATVEGVSSLPWPLTVGNASREGTFSGRSGYSVAGTVKLEERSAGFVVQFEADFQTQSGPGLYVYLGKNGSNGNGAVELDALQATRGAQTYPIPASIDPAEFDFVLIYCKPFGVVFGAAELQ